MSTPITGATRVCALIGDPVTHSLSPTLHNAAYRALGVDLVYVAHAVRPGDGAAALAGAAVLGLVGLSVTTPHKDDVAAACDQRSPAVERLGAANTVRFPPGSRSPRAPTAAGTPRRPRVAPLTSRPRGAAAP